MQWDASPTAGFTTGTPWLPLSADTGMANASVQKDHPSSLLTLYRKLIRLRREEPVLRDGDCLTIDSPGETVAYLRMRKGASFLVALNLGGTAVPWTLSADHSAGTIVLSTLPDRNGEEIHGQVLLREDEGLLIRLTSAA